MVSDMSIVQRNQALEAVIRLQEIRSPIIAAILRLGEDWKPICKHGS